MKNKIKYWKCLVCTILILSKFSISLVANTSDSGNLKTIEDSLKVYFSKLALEQNDIVKEELNEKILKCFRNAFENRESFDYKFDSLKNIGVIESDDRKLRIITWNLPYNDRTHKYFGFIQFKKSKKLVLTIELEDKSDEITSPETAILDHHNWYGVLYYKIISNKYKGSMYYTLLGADLNDLLTKKKIVEILKFDKQDNPIFGKEVFKNRIPEVSRVIFEYSAQANMVLTYDPDREMIVYDHLSPSKPSLKGQYEFYGPDFSYDGLKFERGIWNTYNDIDARNYNLN